MTEYAFDIAYSVMAALVALVSGLSLVLSCCICCIGCPLRLTPAQKRAVKEPGQVKGEKLREALLVSSQTEEAAVTTDVELSTFRETAMESTEEEVEEKIEEEDKEEASRIHSMDVTGAEL
ncbi:unnamed protein product [Chrysoparadoxa australica]